MSQLAKSFIASDHEANIRESWEKSGFFNPDKLDLPADAKAYTIVLPPPNVTDRLHLGHASMIAIEDLLIRYHRMKGFRTLWLPGTDHAAIATQAVVEKALYKESGQTRHDLGREAFLKRVTDFALTTQETILGQIKSMGASLDWSRLAFTLDEPRQKAVRKMFVDMYEAGALYRGERIVNWCPHCQSTLSDDEVEYKTEKTILYTFKYDKAFPISISTTRPETKLGDTAVAVNPKDDRYKKYIGQTIEANFCGQILKLKIIGDHEVDMTFGTGALGVTPAHSMIDWRMAEVNDLPKIKVINEQAKINENFGEYSGLTVSEAREKIIARLKDENLIEKEEEIEHNISICYRCGTGIEPLPSLQWFVAVDKPLKRLSNKSLKEAALEVAEKNKINFVPERFGKQYCGWMKNLRDWCVSRQIWFGHQIPVWYKGEEIYVGVTAPEGEGWKQDEDTLDTWFSSGMWTFSTLGWPEETKDLKTFHPTDVLETGYEIITLWVSRMIMMSLFALKEIPFKTVYLHGMVLDKDGKKMSKSKGNGLDPVEVAKEFGTDAVRLSLLLGNTPGTDLRINEDKIASFRNFSNKLWNISRYILSQTVSQEKIDSKALTVSESWILSRLQTTIKTVTEKIETHDFSGAGEALRVFTLDDLADWYLEASKFENSSQKNLVLYYILERVLKLWHPFMPFVTEAIWQSYHQDLLLVVEWPTLDKKLLDDQAEKDFALVREVIVAIRNLRSEHRLPPAEKVDARLYAGKNSGLLNNFAALISSLRTGLGELSITPKGEPVPGALYAITSEVEIYLQVEVNAAAERTRLESEFKKITALKESLATRLENKEFVAKAPKEIIANEKNKLAEYNSALEKIKQRLSELS